jgi:acyl phosphate:glycerol-3-phosphate acyltransferase
MFCLFIALVLSYLIGSLPTAFVMGKWLKGVDIRKHGSGNVGATNAFRVLGKAAGTTVLLIDVCKGIVAVTLVGNIFGLAGIVERVLLGLAVVCGHNWTIFLNFKGGKGMATSLGVLIGLSIIFPALGKVLILCVLIWLAVFLTTRYVSLASVTAAVGLPLLMACTRQSSHFVILGIIFSVFVLVRHYSNIKRLIAGTESRVTLPWNKRKSP